MVDAHMELLHLSPYRGGVCVQPRAEIDETVLFVVVDRDGVFGKGLLAEAVT